MVDRRESERSTEMEQKKTVTFHGQQPGLTSPLLSPNKSDPEPSQFIQSSRRHRTDLNDHQVVESRAFRHAQMFRRPRALHYESLDDDSVISPATTRSRSSLEDDGEERSTDNIPKVRSRLDLFVDLIWVGIIGNLSSNFGQQAYEESYVGVGTAIAEFILLFIPIWRTWDNLRVYTSSFFIDDIIQRKFTLWILVLAVLYGINAPFAFDPAGGGNSLRFLIIVYITTKASFLAAYGLQAVFLPFLRKLLLFQAVFTAITTGLWVLVLFIPYPHKIILLALANAVEHPVAVFLASPTADRLLANNIKRNPDVDHCVDRHEGFFIIILGEGVFRLIEGSPSGMGLNAQTGTVLTALLSYYMLHWLYFNGDQSKEYVHALRRTWWKPVLWQM
jgi:low temperature requirement protein LtrA